MKYFVIIIIKFFKKYLKMEYFCLFFNFLNLELIMFFHFLAAS